MDRPTVVVFDDNTARRLELYRALGAFAHAIPVGSLADLGRFWPEDAWFFIPDDPEMLETLSREMMARAAFCPIVVYAEDPHISRAIAAIIGGAVHYLAWPGPLDALAAEMRQPAPAVERRLRRMATISTARRKLARLTQREREVLEATRLGLSSKEVARRLGISPRTVEIHRSNALRRLDAPNMIAAMALIIEAEQLDQAPIAA